MGTESSLEQVRTVSDAAVNGLTDGLTGCNDPGSSSSIYSRKAVITRPDGTGTSLYSMEQRRC